MSHVSVGSRRGSAQEWLRALFLAVSVAFFVTYGLRRELMSDEVWSLEAVLRPFREMMPILKNDIHPPLYYLLLKLWTAVFGVSEPSVHSLSAVLSLCTGIVTYLFVKRRAGVDAGTLAAVIYFASPLALLAGRLGRMYSLLGLVSALSTFLFLELVREERVQRRMLLLYAAANILGTFTHLWFFFLLFAQGLCWLILCRARHFRALAAGWAASLAPYAVLWGPVLIRQIRKGKEAIAWIEPPGVTDLYHVALLYSLPLWFVAPLLALVYWKTRRGFQLRCRYEMATLAATLAAALLVPFAISQWKPVFGPRFAIIALPAFAAAVGMFVSRIEARVLPVLLCLVGLVTCWFNKPPVECGTIAGAKYIQGTLAKGDAAIFTYFSRLPTDFYLRGASAGGVVETSFPREIDEHPGYEGRVYGDEHRAALEQEAEALVRSLRARALEHPGMRIVFFHGIRPEVDELVVKRLDRSFERVATECVQCGEGLESAYTRRTVFSDLRGAAGGGQGKVLTASAR